MGEITNLPAITVDTEPQIAKRDRLYRLIRGIGGYCGWNMYDAAVDLIKRDCPCCSYPHCGHKHE